MSDAEIYVGGFWRQTETPAYNAHLHIRKDEVTRCVILSKEHPTDEWSGVEVEFTADGMTVNGPEDVRLSLIAGQDPYDSECHWREGDLNLVPARDGRN